VPEENFWTLWCKGRFTEADKLTIWLGATPSGLTSAHFHHPPILIDSVISKLIYFLQKAVTLCLHHDKIDIQALLAAGSETMNSGHSNARPPP